MVGSGDGKLTLAEVYDLFNNNDDIVNVSAAFSPFNFRILIAVLLLKIFNSKYSKIRSLQQKFPLISGKTIFSVLI